jgi:UDP-glucose 4-epimerase
MTTRDGEAELKRRRVLVTGSSGLIGRVAREALGRAGVATVGLDLVASGAEWGDVRDFDRVCEAVAGCEGVLHLAAVSRVVSAEQDPERCWATSVGGTRNLLDAIAGSQQRPWLVFASSREVYGNLDAAKPVDEDAPRRPVNVYGRSKVGGEELVEEARSTGLRACTVRFSNVFGRTADHADRVIPAFVRAAITGASLRVDGADHTFDFTHVDDVARGLVALTDSLERGAEPPPPIHFVSGTGTSLGELARLAIDVTESRSSIELAPPREFDVEHFVGTGARARRILGWRPQIGLRQGLARLARDFRAVLAGDNEEGER